MRLRFATSLAVAGLVAITACSDNDSGSGADATSFPDETSDGSRINFTPTITITEEGFLPLQAVAVFGETLTFVNETDRPQTIQFTNGSPKIGGPETIGPIAPGESMSFPDPLEAAISLVYEADALPGHTGRLQVDPGVDTL